MFNPATSPNGNTREWKNMKKSNIELGTLKMILVNLTIKNRTIENADSFYKYSQTRF